MGDERHRPHGASNELWDLLVYGSAALDLLVWNMSKEAELEFTDWVTFWDVCEAGEFFTVPDSN